MLRPSTTSFSIIPITVLISQRSTHIWTGKKYRLHLILVGRFIEERFTFCNKIFICIRMHIMPHLKPYFPHHDRWSHNISVICCKTIWSFISSKCVFFIFISCAMLLTIPKIYENVSNVNRYETTNLQI